MSDRAGEVFAGDGVAIHYELVGHGPVVLLLHGFTSTYQDTWVETGWVADVVRAGWSPLGIDVRGHGLSGKPLSAAAYTPDVLVADVLTVLNALGTRRVHAIGFSMGGGVLLNLARSYPRRLLRAAVAGVGDAAIRGQPDDGSLRAIVAALDASDERTVGDPLGRRIRHLASRAGNDRCALAAMARAGGWPGYIVDLGPVAVPLLIAHAERDEFMADVQQLRTAHAAASWLEVAQAKHTDLLRAPTFRSAALHFLADAAAPGG